MDATDILIVGAGLSGAVLAREFAEHSAHRVLVIDRRPHLAGNCHTERDAETGVMVHRYGPHVFNTNHEDVWRYVRRFGEWMPFVNRVKAVNRRGVFSLPINLGTINQFFGRTFSPDEARAFVASQADASIGEPRNFEEQALKMLGRELYEGFFYGYTKKQWGCEPAQLPASVLRRLPVRFSYDDNYYDRRYQAIPREGYTGVVERLLDHPAITVRLRTDFDRGMMAGCRRVFYTGALDAFYHYRHGRLGYRTVEFEGFRQDGDIQGSAQVNYSELDVPYTRVHEHRHFTPWETHRRSIAFREYSRETAPGDTPFYPKRLADDLTRLEMYAGRARQEQKVTFVGRLGTYRYLDMDQVIGEALDLAGHYRARPLEVPLVFPQPRAK